MEHYAFFHQPLNFETFQNLDPDTSDLKDTIRAIPDSEDTFTDPLRIERIDTYGSFVASTECVRVREWDISADIGIYPQPSISVHICWYLYP